MAGEARGSALGGFSDSSVVQRDLMLAGLSSPVGRAAHTTGDRELSPFNVEVYPPVLMAVRARPNDDAGVAHLATPFRNSACRMRSRSLASARSTS